MKRNNVFLKVKLKIKSNLTEFMKYVKQIIF